MIAQSVSVTGTGNTAVTTITVPSNTVFADSCFYNIRLDTQIPEGTDGTIIAITNGTVTGELMLRGSGNYARSRLLNTRRVIKVQFFSDPDHFNLVFVK